MTSISESTRSLHSALRRLYTYGPHIQLAALTTALLETAILWQALPQKLLLSAILCHLCLSSVYIYLVRSARQGSSLKVSKSWRPLLFLSLLQALCWGSTILLITNGTLLLYAIHALFLYGICILFTLYLAAIATMAYCFLAISLTPMLYTLFFKAPAYMAPLARCLLALTILLAGIIYFYSRALMVPSTKTSTSSAPAQAQKRAAEIHRTKDIAHTGPQ